MITGALFFLPAVAPPSATAQATPITWEACPPLVDRPGAKCGRIEVPMDYTHPQGEKISVGFLYFAATGGAKDTIFTNPGGPGGSVYEVPGTHNVDYPAEFFRDYNIVSVQPRGLPGSTPMFCLEEPQNVASNVGQDCSLEEGRPGYDATITTESTARDWDEVRKALRLERISIYGLSYGTILGSVYATLFPERTNRVVLDSGADTEHMWAQIMLNQEAGFTRSLHDFFAWAAQNNDKYGLGTTPYQVYRTWAERIRQDTGAYPPATPPAATAADLPAHSTALGQGAVAVMNATEDHRAKAESVITQGLSGNISAASRLYQMTPALLPMPSHWDDLARGIRDYGVFDRFTKDAIGDMTDEAVGELIVAGLMMQNVIMCNEATNPVRPELYPRLIWQQTVAADPFVIGPLTVGTGATCVGAPAITRVPALNGAGLKVRPLQLQGISDPQTPYNNFWNMRAQMNSHLITVHGPGHGMFGTGNKAVNQVVLDYFGGANPTVTDLPGYFG